MHPTVCVCYIEANESEALNRSLATMTKYPWVQRVVVLHTDQDKLPRTFNRVEHVYKDYGSGFDRQPAQGGFDEIAARNHMLRLGRDSGCSWLLLLDADEFFLPSTIDPIADAHRSYKDVIFFECWHFFSPTQYLFFDDTVRALTKNAPKLHDPHIRAIRAGSDSWFETNRNEAFLASIANRTAHCSPTHRNWDVALHAPGVYHIHTHHMYGAKRQSFLDSRDPTTLPLRTARSGNLFPKAYLDAFQSAEEPVSLGSSSISSYSEVSPPTV